MDIHAWIDIASVVGLVSCTLGGVVLAHRLAKSDALSEKVNQHESRLAAVETALEWIRKLFKQ